MVVSMQGESVLPGQTPLKSFASFEAQPRTIDQESALPYRTLESLAHSVALVWPGYQFLSMKFYNLVIEVAAQPASKRDHGTTV